jgi:threonine aldolase
MSRRARAVELWATLKYLGKDGVDNLVYGLHQRATQFAKELSEEGFKILNDVVFNQVLVACESDSETEKVLINIQDLRECWCGGSQWFGKRVIRISVCSWSTTSEDVTRSVASFVKARGMIS